MSDEIDQLIKKRLDLLRKKYNGSLSYEDQAELNRITKRLRILIPRVTDEDRSALERIKKEIRR